MGIFTKYLNTEHLFLFFFKPDSMSCRRCSHSSHPENQPSISIQLNKEKMEILWIKLKENRWRVDNYFKQTSPNWAALENALLNNFTICLFFFNLDMSERNWGGKSDTGIALSMSQKLRSTHVFGKVMKTFTCIDFESKANCYLVDLNKKKLLLLLRLKSCITGQIRKYLPYRFFQQKQKQEKEQKSNREMLVKE